MARLGRPPKRWLAPQEAAALLGVSTTRIRWLARTGRLRGYRQPGVGRTEYRREDVERLRHVPVEAETWPGR